MEETTIQLAAEANLEVEAAKAQILKAMRRAVWLVLLFSSLAVVLGVVLSLIVARGISVPLRQSLDFTVAVANGDLSQVIALNRKDELGELTAALNAMARNLAQNPCRM